MIHVVNSYHVKIRPRARRFAQLFQILADSRYASQQAAARTELQNDYGLDLTGSNPYYAGRGYPLNYDALSDPSCLRVASLLVPYESGIAPYDGDLNFVLPGLGFSLSQAGFVVYP